MKVKIKECFGDLPNYLTLGKVYKVTPSVGFEDLYDLRDDVGDTLNIDLEDCVHLNNGSWEVVSE